MDYDPYIRDYSQILKMTGTLITFEGCDGSGKTTFSEILKDDLSKKYPDRKVHVFREPGGTPMAEKIRNICVNEQTCKDTELLLFIAARMELINSVVIPYLENGDIVILDRYIDSTYVYQGLLRKFGVHSIRQLQSLFPIPEPDIRIFLDIDPMIAMKRKNDQGEIQKFESLNMMLDVRAYYKMIYFYIFNNEYKDTMLYIDTGDGNQMSSMSEHIFKHVISIIEMDI